MKACPAIRLSTQTSRGKSSSIETISVEAKVDGKTVGLVIVEKPRGDPPYVGFVEVDLKRCGIGTRLYERAAKIACKEFGQPLHSDVLRSDEAQGFWAKQVRKGRATCVGPVDPEQPRLGRDGCLAYKLTCPAPTDLGRARRRR